VQQAGEYGIRVDAVKVDWAAVKVRVASVVTGMRAMNEKNLTSPPALDFILGEARFVGPRILEVRELSGAVRQGETRKSTDEGAGSEEPIRRHDQGVVRAGSCWRELLQISDQ
jgi:hypothetical protein